MVRQFNAIPKPPSTRTQADTVSERSADGKADRKLHLFGSLEHDLGGSPTGRRSRVGQLQFVSRERENTFLIGPIPIRERTAHDVNDDGMVRLAY